MKIVEDLKAKLENASPEVAKAWEQTKGGACWFQVEPVSNTLYFQKFGKVYKKMYEIYQMCNQICWEGQLPICIIEIPRKFTMRNAYAYFQAYVLYHNGRRYHKISFQRQTFDSRLELWLEVLLHEMVHVWQSTPLNHEDTIFPYRHGKVFWDEAKRIGIGNCIYDFIEENSLAAQVLHEISCRYPSIEDELLELIKTNIQHNPRDDVNFFAEQYIPTFSN